MVTRSPLTKDEILLEVEGPLEGEPAALFQAELETVATGPYRTVTLDLSRVPSINSSSIGRILLVRKKLADQGRCIRIRACSDALRATFRLIRLDRLVPIADAPRGLARPAAPAGA